MLIDLNIQVASWVSVLFISLANEFPERKKKMYDSLVLTLHNSLLLWLFQAWYLYVFSHFPWLFQKLYYLSTWKNLFRNHFLYFLSSSVFIWKCGFNQISWLNRMTLCNVFNNNPWFNDWFKFLLCITLFSIIQIGYKFLKFIILSCKKGKSLWSSWNPIGDWISTSTKHPPWLYSL